MSAQPQNRPSQGAPRWAALWRRIPLQTLVLVVVLIVNIILVGPSLTPHYSSINAHDEAKYIESGRLLLRGEVRNLVWGPLVALFYAPFHLMFGTSPDWFLLDAWGGSILLFAFMWLSFYHLGNRFADVVSPYAVMGLLFLTPPLFDVLSNPSDALFVGLSALSLATLIDFRRRPSNRLAAIGSALLGFAVLARFESIILLPFFLLAVGVFARRRNWRWSLGAAAVLPATFLLVIYLGAFGLSTGTFDLGIKGKSYASFEMNQPLRENGDDAQKVQRTRQLFGTPQENQSSVIRAGLRNPKALVERITLNLRDQPDRFLQIYGKRLGPAIAILAMLGLVALIMTRDWAVLGLLILWALQPAISLIFLPLHFLRQLAYLPILFAAAGVTLLITESSRTWIRMATIVASFGLLAYGLLDAKLAFATTGVVLVAALLLLEVLDQRKQSQSLSAAGGMAARLLLLLAAGLILREPYRFPDFPAVGTSEREQAVHVLQQHFKPGAFILEPLPLPAVAAKLNRYPISNIPDSLQDARGFHDWMQSKSIAGIYVEGDWTDRPDLLQQIEQSTSLFELVFKSESGFIRIFASR